MVEITWYNFKKKTKLYKERDEKKRKEYTEEISKYKEEDIVYIDESGINEYMYRERARAPKGKKVIGEVSGKRFQRTSIIAGKNGKKIYAPLTHKNTTNSEVFNTWLEKELLPQIGSGKVIVMDNASFHKSKRTKELIEQSDCKLIYLPPYSPDLNPIEQFWSWLKRTIRSVMHNFSSLEQVLNYVFCGVN
jgi:transposase